MLSDGNKNRRETETTMGGPPRVDPTSYLSHVIPSTAQDGGFIFAFL
jgi:hypothetical protein